VTILYLRLLFRCANKFEPCFCITIAAANGAHDTCSYSKTNVNDIIIGLLFQSKLKRFLCLALPALVLADVVGFL